MPGLRSLVARRRCSLPSGQISSGPIICSYPSVPGPISLRKGHSLDEIHPSENVSPDKSSKDDKSKWDLKTLFEVKDEPLSPNQDIIISNENLLSNSSGNDINLNGSEKENNHAGVQYQTDFFDPLELQLKQEIKSENILQEENSMEIENVGITKNVSPERIVIKMKLLHGSSLSDVTNISPDSSDGNESIKSEFQYERTCTPNTQWRIDSILNQPFVESDYSDCTNSISSGIFSDNLQITNLDLNDKNDTENYVDSTQDVNSRDEENSVNPIKNNDVLHSVPCHNPDDYNSQIGESSSIGISDQESAVLSHQEKYDDLRKNSQVNEIKLIETIRRASGSSDVSEDSVCSEASMGSSRSSSASSVKSCSIVIKRLENSDTYSCFRSPKSKRKKRQGNEFTKTVVFNGKSSLPVLYIQKRLLFDTKSDILPCSVTLCDIFSNYSFRKENCPKCFRFYNLKNDVYVDIYCNTLTLQCLSCKWLVVRSLNLKEIDLNIQRNQNCN